MSEKQFRRGTVDWARRWRNPRNPDVEIFVDERTCDKRYLCRRVDRRHKLSQVCRIGLTGRTRRLSRNSFAGAVDAALFRRHGVNQLRPAGHRTGEQQEQRKDARQAMSYEFRQNPHHLIHCMPTAKFQPRYNNGLALGLSQVTQS